MSNRAAVTIGYAIGTRKAANTFTAFTGGFTDIDPFVAAVGIATAWEESIMTQVNQSVTMDLVRVRDLDGSSQYFFNPNVVGAVAVAGAPPNVSFLVRCPMEGTVRGGRWFIPGVSEAAVDALGNVLPEYINGLTSAALEFIETLADFEGQPLIVQKPSGETFRTVINPSCDSLVSTQRRRLR